MSRGQRIGFLALAVVVAVAAFVAFRPGDDSENPGKADNEKTTKGAATGRTGEPQARRRPSAPLLTAQAVKTINARKGDRIRLRARSARADEVHVHGYDILKPAPAGRTVRLSFAASIEGIFEIELERSGTVIGKLKVEP